MFRQAGVAMAVFAVAVMVRGQEPAHGFDVAAIRVNRDATADSNFNSLPGGRLIVTSESLRELIRFAFGIKDFQITGAPAWVDSDKYDIDGKTADPNLRMALQALMGDRFALKCHKEMKEATVYSLGIGKGGLKMTRTACRCACYRDDAVAVPGTGCPG